MPYWSAQVKRAGWALAVREVFAPVMAKMDAGVELTAPDGVTYTIFPRLLSYVADYMEVIALLCLKFGQFPCEKCWCPVSICLD